MPFERGLPIPSQLRTQACNLASQVFAGRLDDFAGWFRDFISFVNRNGRANTSRATTIALKGTRAIVVYVREKVHNLQAP